MYSISAANNTSGKGKGKGVSLLSLNSTETAFLVASSWNPCEDVAKKSGGNSACQTYRTRMLDDYKETAVVEFRLYATSLTAIREFTCNSVIRHPAEVTFPLLSQAIKAGTRFSDSGGMQG